VAFKVKDHYFKKAKQENFVARSIYKLEEIDKKFKIISKNNKVVDLGYYPGSWLQYVAPRVLPEGKVVGIDIKPINEKMFAKLKNVQLWQKDIMDVQSVADLGEEEPFDIVLSDMAPNTSGVKSVDQLRSLSLVEMVFSLLPIFLKKNGHLVIKVFESNEAQVFLKEQKKRFKEFHYLRPKSTRSTSKEFFLVAKGFLA